MTTFGLSMASWRHRRLRTLVGLVSIAVASMMLTLSLAATKQLRSAVTGSDPRSIIILAFRAPKLPAAYVAQAQGALGGAANLEWNGVTGAEEPITHTGLRIIGISPGYFASYPKSHFDVDPAAWNRWLADPQGALLSPNIMAKTGWKIGQTVIFQLRAVQLQVRIVGLGPAGGSDAVLVHYDYFDAATQNAGGRSTITVHGDADADAAIEKLRARFVGSDPAVVVMKEREFLRRIMIISGALPALLANVAIIFALSTLLMLYSNNLVSLRERRAELGTLRVLGFTRARVLAIILGEFFAVAAVAEALGCGIPYLLYHERGVDLGILALANLVLSASSCATVVAGTFVLGGFVVLASAFSTVRARPLELSEGT